ncbi:hypothetical protein PR048_004708 [Dryococelus australis]|uniref:DUF4371 domain-containing protein n=1 Tax=Dryococelus australis TaxID=614101 RepID=A0ABQ9I652_9NEOP|nr:hypothetical protein PR048_004708 [Dryococelus australis]
MSNNVKLASLKESDKNGTVAEKVNAQYSEDNELLSIIEEQIKLHIGNKVREAKTFAIIADETQYRAKHEEVAVVLRHVNENLEVHESFVGFYRAEKSDGEKLANLLKNVLVSLELDIKNLHAQCYDRASNIRGPYKGVAARILEENPTAINLKKYKKLCVGMVTLKSLSDTRWACRVEAVRSLLDNFEVTLSALQEISQTEPDSGGQAIALLKSMEDSNFVFDILLLRIVLTQSAELARNCKIPAIIGNGSKAPFETVQQLYKVTILNPVIDILEQEIEARL